MFCHVFMLKQKIWVIILTARKVVLGSLSHSIACLVGVKRTMEGDADGKANNDSITYWAFKHFVNSIQLNYNKTL